MNFIWNSQLVRYNAKGQIGIGERCVDADKSSVKLIFCPMGKVDGPWEYDEVRGSLFNHLLIL